MRPRRPALLTAVLTLLAVTVVAAPARADHVAELRPEAGLCVMGGLESRIGANVSTTRYTHIVKNGVTTGYVCRFDALPLRSDWYLPPTSPGLFRVSGFGCWLPDSEDPRHLVESWISRWTAYPDGRGTLVCQF